MRFSLVPVGCRVEVIRPMVGMPMLHRHPKRFLKRDGALNVPAVEASTATDSLWIYHVRRAVVLIVEGLVTESPRSVIVVLASRTINGGQSISIDENHVVALAKPARLVLLHSMGYTHKMPFACGLHEDIIVLPVQVFAVAHRIVPVILPIVGPALAGRGLAILRMEAAQAGWYRGNDDVVEGKVEIVGADRSFVGQRDAGRTRKWHLKISIHRLDGRNREQSRLISEILAQAQAEEVADGDFDGGRGFSVPPGAKDQVLQVHWIARVDGEPEVCDRAGAGGFEQRNSLSSFHDY